MSVDFYPCSKCGEVFCDVGTYSRCETCGEMLCEDCGDEMGISGGMAHEAGEYDYAICPFCSDEIITDEELLGFALKLLGIKRKALEKKYRAI